MADDDVKVLKDLFNESIDRFLLARGVPGMQTYAENVAMAGMDVAAKWREVWRAKRAQSSIPRPTPKGWRWTRVRVGQQWNGTCLDCGRGGKAGECVQWDPQSGVPSRWRHPACADPTKAPPKPPKKKPGDDDPTLF